ncbi:MAG TPA: AAA family ATPase, partial [Acidimicrobiales bacterium]|nr:AAA family ATPase [Acidimicrobiales bacterium]
MGTELLEREPQLDVLTRWWSEAVAGAGRLVFVAGEAGVGKTSLVRRFCEELPAAPRVLVGTCEPLGTPTPLGPVLDMAGALPPRFEEILSGGGDPVVVRRAFLDEIGGMTATLVVVEDAHWADEATLDLLRHVGRRLGGRRCMVVVTYREDEVGRQHPLRVVMGDLATLAEVKRLQLRPLSVAAVAQLTEGLEVDAEQLHRQTGGNPFFVTEVLAAGDVPGSVRDAVLARASRLGPKAREVLDAAACLGARATPALVQEVSRQWPAAVDECLESGMLVLDGEEVTFRHELARLAVEGGVPPGRRTAYHARALDALRELPGVDPARLADHAERAGDRAALFRYACAAAERATRLASHREAAAHYARALDVADDQPDDVRAALLEARSHECYLSHDIGGSHEAAQEARQL